MKQFDEPGRQKAPGHPAIWHLHVFSGWQFGVLQILSAQRQHDVCDASEDTIRETRASIVVAVTSSELLRFEVASGANPIHVYRYIPDADGHVFHSLTFPDTPLTGA